MGLPFLYSSPTHHFLSTGSREGELYETNGHYSWNSQAQNGSRKPRMRQRLPGIRIHQLLCVYTVTSPVMWRSSPFDSLKQIANREVRKEQEQTLDGPHKETPSLPAARNDLDISEKAAVVNKVTVVDLTNKKRKLDQNPAPKKSAKPPTVAKPPKTTQQKKGITTVTQPLSKIAGSSWKKK